MDKWKSRWSMRIEKLHLDSFRGISDAKIDFNGQATVIFGVNGMGKTSVLDACNIIFSKLLRMAAMDEQMGTLYIKERDVKKGDSSSAITAELSIDSKWFSYYRKRMNGKNLHDSTAARQIVKTIQTKYLGSVDEMDSDMEEEDKPELSLKLDDKNIPVYVFYSVDRHISESRRALRKYTGAGGKMEAWYAQIFDGNININLFFDWFRLQQEKENSRKIEDVSYVDEQFDAVRRAVLTTLGEDFSAIKVKIIEESPEMVLVKKGVELNLKQLSEGEKVMIALVGDIARRLFIANPSRIDQLQGEGIVLIDEIDLHLHPSWQARVMPALMKIFPKIQFIVTTHSPRVLGELGDNVNIVKLEQGENDVTVRDIKPLKGWDVNAILEEWMGTDSINQEIQHMINEMYRQIELKDLSKAQQLLDRLEMITDDKNLDVVKGRILITKDKMNASNHKK